MAGLDPLQAQPFNFSQMGGMNLPFRIVSILPLTAFVAAFVAFPIGQLVWMSFGDVQLKAGSFSWSFAGLENFQRMLGDDMFLSSVRVTSIFTVSAVLLTLLFGTAMALAVNTLTKRSKWAQNVLVWPAIVTPVVISVLWILLLNPQIGLINKFLPALGLESQTWLASPGSALAAIVVVDVWHWTPVVFLFVFAALSGIDDSIIEAATVDGADFFERVRHILLPLIMPAIMAAAAVRFVMSIKAFDEMYLLTYGGPAHATTVLTIYLKSVFSESYDYSYGAALSVTVVMVVVLVVGAIAGSRSLVMRQKNG
jgi:multiple sugar transport system permease protein